MQTFFNIQEESCLGNACENFQILKSPAVLVIVRLAFMLPTHKIYFCGLINSYSTIWDLLDSNKSLVIGREANIQIYSAAALNKGI